MSGEVAFKLFAILIVCWFIYSLLPERKERAKMKPRGMDNLGIKGRWYK